MALKIYTEPVEEPIPLDDITKKHLRVDSTDDDDLIERYIKAARLHCEGWHGRRYITQTWELYLDSFPETDYIEIPYPPLQSITQLQYKNSAGTLTTWAATNYIVDSHSEPGRLCLAYGISWPTIYGTAQSVQIRFVCGYGLSTNVPAHIKEAIKKKATDLYQHRGDEVVDINIERDVENLLWNDRIVPL